MDIYPLVQMALAKGASDLHFVASSPPVMRIDGTLQPIDGMLAVCNDPEEITKLITKTELQVSQAGLL